MEDNPLDADLFTLAMRRFPIEVIHARNGTDAQRMLRHDRDFRAVFVDLGIPCMDGLDLVRWVKDRYPELPIAILSGVEIERARAKSMDVGAIFIFSKPFTSTDLQAVLNLIDMTTALYRLAQKNRNWRTTLCGIAAMIVGGVLLFTGERTTAIGMFVVGAGLFCAQDAQMVSNLIGKAKGKE